MTDMEGTRFPSSLQQSFVHSVTAILPSVRSSVSEHTPQSSPDIWLTLLHFSHLLPAGQLSVCTLPQPPLAALAKGMADSEPHRPFFPTTELLPHLLFLTIYLCCRLLLYGWWTLHFTGLVQEQFLQFVQFLRLESYPPICLQFPPTQCYVCRFEKQILFFI